MPDSKPFPRRTPFAVCIAVTLVVAACGGAADQDVFGNAISTSDAGSGDDDGSASGSDGAKGDDSGGTSQDGGGGQDGGSKTDGGPKKDSGATDSGADVTPPTPKIHCEGVSDCTVGSEVCCRVPGPTFSCTATSGCTGIGDVPIPCDEANDCTALGHAGDVCCASLGIGGRFNKVECASAGNCAGNSKEILCNPQDSDPCPNGGTCASGASGGYFACQ